MLSALRSLTLIVASLAVITGILWGFARLNGVNQPISKPLSHPFLREGAKEIIAYHPGNSTNLISALDTAAAVSKDIILWIEARPQFDGTLVVAATDAETKSAPPLLDVIQHFADRRLILNFHGYREGMAEAVASVIEKSKAEKRVLMQSPEDGFLKDLREKQPLWIFGTSLATITRLLMLSSVGLESAAPIKADVIIVERRLKDDMSHLASATVINEAHRRRLLIFAGPVRANTDEALQLWNRGIDGILTDHPEQLLLSTQPH